MENPNSHGQSTLELALIMMVLVGFVFTALGFANLSQHWLKTAQLSREHN